MLLQNTGIQPENYTAQEPRRPHSKEVYLASVSEIRFKLSILMHKRAANSHKIAMFEGDR